MKKKKVAEPQNSLFEEEYSSTVKQDTPQKDKNDRKKPHLVEGLGLGSIEKFKHYIRCTRGNKL